VVLTDKAGAGAKSFLIIQLSVFGSIGCGMLFETVNLLLEERYGLAIAISIFSTFFVLIAARILIRISKSEHILLAADSLQLVSRKMGMNTMKEYEYDSILNLCYVGKGAHMTENGLNTWATVQRSNMVVDDGDIAFYYKGKLVRFGIGATIWDIEELSALIEEKSSGRVSIAGLPEEIGEDEWKVA